MLFKLPQIPAQSCLASWDDLDRCTSWVILPAHPACTINLPQTTPIEHPAGVVDEIGDGAPPNGEFQALEGNSNAATLIAT